MHFWSVEIIARFEELLEALKCYKDIEGQKEVQQNFENSKAVTELYFTSLDHL